MRKPKPPRKSQVIQKFAKALADKSLPRRVGNALTNSQPSQPNVMGGNTKLNPKSMKAVALSTGRPSNLNLKKLFTKEN